jgi:phenylalanyl-tRNA synthetase beta chain
MRFSEAWLRDWADPAVSTAELVEQLTMAGLEVDSVQPAAPEFNGVVVGEVLSVEPHPDARKLRVCQVGIGGGAPLGIVCGAPNVEVGMRAPTALVGAVLPGGFKIKKAKLRGVESLGMLCSTAELGLAESSEGLMALPGDAPVGEDIRRYLGLDDQLIEIDLTPDRGDCLSIAGVAKEVGVINRIQTKQHLIQRVEPDIEDRFEVLLEAGEACPRYACRILRGIDPLARTPFWLAERLRRGGIRSLSPVVDVTNYVLLELGQPMHGFDLGKLDGRIRVRLAAANERLELLDGQAVELREDSLVIADQSKALALAGIMGGEGSGVTEATTDILLESAFFAPTAIIGKARSYGLHTDSSHRFERGVDPELQVRALERATALLQQIVGGQAGPVVEVSSPAHLPRRNAIRLRRTRVARLLGVEIASEQIRDILERLEMQVTDSDDGWLVTPPSARFDIGIEADLIEEIGRIYGYAEIPTRLAPSSMRMHAPREEAFDLVQARQALVERGYQEAITYSFVDPGLQRLVDPLHEGISLANPIAADMSVMRTSLWPGLLQVARYNQARQQGRIRLFETGLRFLPGSDSLQQHPMLGGLISGNVEPEQWGKGSRGVDFFDMKGDLEALLTPTGRLPELLFRPAEHRALHPGQSARVECEGRQCGWIGMLHPELQHKLDLAGDTFLFEIDLEVLGKGRLPAFRPLSKFPQIRRDLAIVVDAAVSYRHIRDLIGEIGGEILKDIRLFDVYTGEHVESGRKSLALGLILQASSHTLTDEEVEDVVGKVLKTLKTEIGAQLRD